MRLPESRWGNGRGWAHKPLARYGAMGGALARGAGTGS